MKKPAAFFPWPDLSLANRALQGALLAFESQQVIALRLAKISRGGADAPREAQLMVSEKLATMAEGGQMMLHAALGGQQDLGADSIIQLYRRKVRANKRRLGG